MSAGLYYDREGNEVDSPVDLTLRDKSWDEMFRVASTERDGVRVSTVFLSISHQFGDGPPLIFETMVFGGDLDEEQVRYSTEAEALAGHEAMCARVWPASTENKGDET